MTLQEAIRSGKRFKLNHSPVYYVPSSLSTTSYYLTREELLSDDWEVEEETVPLSKSQVLDIYLLGVAHEAARDPKNCQPLELQIRLRNLGFKE